MPTPEQIQQAQWFELAFEWGPLHRAAFFGDRDRVRFLLAAGEDAHYRALDQWRPIDVSATVGDLVVWREFVDVGVAPDVHTLLAAAEGGSIFAVSAVLSEGVPLEAAFPDPEGTTALMSAARKGHANVVRHLARLGAEVDRAEARSGWTALHHAAFSDAADAVRVLIQEGADADLGDWRGQSAFETAMPKRLSAAFALIQEGASRPDGDPKNLIHTLALLGDLDLLRLAFDCWDLADDLTVGTIRRVKKKASPEVVDFLRSRRRRPSGT